MMLPRLQLLRELLREDGSIWVTIDDNEGHYLKVLMDEVFGRGNFVLDMWGHTQEAMLESKKLFGQASFFGTPKPERLLQRILHIATNPNDLVLDSFLGSGTTAAVAHKMGRRWIGIEMGEHAATHCLPRLEKVIAGEQGGISQAVNWQGGGGFRFARLGAPMFDADGCIHPEVRFATLAAFVWQQETGTALNPANGQAGTPWLGTHSVFDSCSRLPDAPEEAISIETAAPEPVLRSRTAYYLLFNGILGDKRPASGNVLTRAVLDALLQLHASTPHPEAPLVVYGEANRLGPETLARARVTFRHIPYDVKAR
jgi:adenine-specific DNA-methyltransferase